METTSVKMTLSSLNWFQLGLKQPRHDRWQKLKNSGDLQTFFCLKTRSWWVISLNSDQMRSTTSTQRTDNGPANDF